MSDQSIAEIARRLAVTMMRRAKSRTDEDNKTQAAEMHELCEAVTSETTVTPLNAI